MKHISSLFSCSVLLLGAVIFNPLPLTAQPLVPSHANTPPFVKLLAGSLEFCLREKLQSEQQIQQFKSMATQAESEIRQACRAGKQRDAHRIALHYAGTAQGKATLQCIRTVAPMVQQPFVQQQLGKHAGTVNQLVAGTIPHNICQ